MRSRFALLVALASCASCGSSESHDERPNVVVVVIDTLRPDHLPAYGYERDTAPFLTELARESAVFERAFSSSTWTAPATASLFTSLYPTQHGVTHGFFVHRTKLVEEGKLDGSKLSLVRMPEAVPTLPELFQRAGYETLGLAANVNIGAEIGFDRGFDRFERSYGSDNPKGASAAWLVERLERWRSERTRTDPSFVYLHFNDVHEPYDKSSPHYIAQGEPLADDRAAYDAEIRAVDDALAQAYRAFGWRRNTLLVVVSDHGEEFMEHGGTGHGFSVYRELAQIALVIRGPELGVAPSRVRENVSIVDLVPTLAELCDLPAPKHCEGRSLATRIVAGRTLPARELYVHRSNRELKRKTAAREKESAGELWAVIDGDWKLVRRGESVELYDFARDPSESRDLAAQEPQVLARLREKLSAFEARATAVGSGSVDVELDPAQARALKQLGYAGDH